MEPMGIRAGQMELEMVRRRLDSLNAMQLNGPLDRQTAAIYGELCALEHRLLVELAAQEAAGEVARARLSPTTTDGGTPGSATQSESECLAS